MVLSINVFELICLDVAVRKADAFQDLVIVFLCERLVQDYLVNLLLLDSLSLNLFCLASPLAVYMLSLP